MSRGIGPIDITVVCNKDYKFKMDDAERSAMQSYKQSSEQSGMEPWLDFEEEGVEVLEGNPKQSGRID
jgi:hypothetical protein